MGRLQRQTSIALHARADQRLTQIWTTIKFIVYCIVQCARYIWKHNPVKIFTERQRRLFFVENYEGLVIKPKLKERMMDLFLTDFRRRKRLLHWVHTKLRSTEVHDFSTCWHDGTILCALLESICPGVCPSFHLLSPLNMVKNCRLGIKLANKYLYVPMDLLTPEEMAIATKDTEFKIIQYISMIKWASQNIREKWTILHESLIAAKTGRCFAKGSGLRNGIVGKRSKFTIVVSDTIGVFNLLVEIRGPNNDYYGERIVSLHQAKGVLEKSTEGTRMWPDSVKYLEDCVGNTFVRKKVPSRFAAEHQTDQMVLDFQSGEEGTFYVTFVPRRAGIHAVSVKWQNHHVENSPFRIKVYKASNVSTKSLKGAQEKRVIFDSLSLSTIPSSLEDGLDMIQSRGQLPGDEPGQLPMNTISKSKAYSRGRQLTVTSRRVLRRIITRNGEDIVIEEAVSPTLSRQSSITDNSDDDRYLRRDRDDKIFNNLNLNSTQNAANVTPSKSITNLGTVLEEKQNSRDNVFKDINLSDIVSSPEFKQKLDEFHLKSTVRLQHRNEANGAQTGNDVIEPEDKVIKSRGDPSVKYTCTELNEHNLLDTYERNKVADENEKGGVSSWFTLPEDDGQWMDRNVVKRSRLKRTTSIKGMDKTIAHRTTSDGTIYSLRRRILSIAASERSDSSEVSSDDRQSGIDDDYGEVVPSLKLLHSDSLKKACMYMSSSRYPNYDVNDDEITHETFPEKTKIKATQSLPILEKALMHKRDKNLNPKEIETSGQLLTFDASKVEESAATCLYSKGSVSGVIKPTARILTPIDNNKDILMSKPGDANTNKLATAIEFASKDEIKTSKLDYIKAEDRVVSRHEQFINQNVFVNVLEDDSDLSESTSTNNYHKTTLYTDIKPSCEKQKSFRGTLKRQWTVICQRSSETGNGNDVSKDGGQQNNLTNQKTETSSSTPNVQFKSIFVQPGEDTGPTVTQEVVIVIPKAKVDKQTQVFHTEITKETGWDLIEGVYLLLRRISVKVPCITTYPPSTESQSSLDLNHVYGKIRKRGLSTGGSKSSSNTSKQTGMDNVGNSSGLQSESNQLYVPTLSDADRTVSDTSSLKGSTTECSLKVSDISNVQGYDGRNWNDQDCEMSQKLACEETIGPDVEDDIQALVRYSDDIAVCTDDTLNHEFEERHIFPDPSPYPPRTRDKHEAVNEWFRRNESFLRIQHRQGTVETVDSGFDDHPPIFNRHARFSLPTLRTANGHVKLHRRPYRGKITLEPDLINSFNSMSLDKKELGNEADDELLFNTSFDNRQNKIQRRRHKLEAREESVSFSDSEINQNKQRRRRSISASRRIKEMALRPDDGIHNTETTFRKDDNKNVTHDGQIDGGNKPIYASSIESTRPPLSKQVMKKSSTTASSMDSNYCGFGVTKINRSLFLSQIGQFQNLCTTEEVPDDTLSHVSRPSVKSSVNDLMDTGNVNNINDTPNVNNMKDTRNTNGIKCTSSVNGMKDTGDVNNINDTPNVKDMHYSYNVNNMKGIDNISDMNVIDGVNCEEDAGNINSKVCIGHVNDIEYASNVNHVKDKVDDTEAIDQVNFLLPSDINNEINLKINEDDGTVLTETNYTENAAKSKSDNKLFDSNLESSSQKYQTDIQAHVRLNSDSLTTVSNISNINNDNDTVTSVSDITSSNVDTSYIDEVGDVFGELININDYQGLSVQRLNESQNGYIRNTLVVDPDSNDVDIVDVSEDNGTIHVAGAGLHQSLVGANNSFQVWTEHLSTGSLSVHISGPRPHTVTETSVLYTGDNLYEVSYGVTQPGLYRIHVKWGDFEIPKSPFMCTAVLI